MLDENEFRLNIEFGVLVFSVVETMYLTCIFFRDMKNDSYFNYQQRVYCYSLLDSTILKKLLGSLLADLTHEQRILS